VARMPGELMVRCQDLDDPNGFFRAYKRRLQAGFRFVYDDPRLGKSDSLPVLLARLREMEAAAEFLSLIARDPDPRMRAAVAGNASLAIADVTAAAHDPSPIVRRAAAAHPWMPPSLLRQLAYDGEEIVREQVAGHLATPPDILLYLTHQAVVRNEAPAYLAAIAEHPRVPAQALTLLALVPMRDGWLVARRRDLPRPTIERILESGPDRCRADLARNPSVDAETLAYLAADSTPIVRMAVARNPGTSEATLELLLHDVDPAVRAANPRTSALELIRLIDVHSRVVTEQVASNTATPSNLLDRLARTWDSDAHAAVAANPSTPSETLRHLFRAGGEAVRKVCLANPACPTDLLRSRAGAHSPHIRATVAANPSTPRDILDVLAEDQSPEVINALAGNSALPHAIHRRIVREPGGLAPNPLAPPDILWQLAIYENDDNYAQRRQVLGNPAFAQAYEVVTTWRETAPDPSAAGLAPTEEGTPS
jgi:hypothetical protein